MRTGVLRLGPQPLLEVGQARLEVRLRSRRPCVAERLPGVEGAEVDLDPADPSRSPSSVRNRARHGLHPQRVAQVAALGPSAAAPPASGCRARRVSYDADATPIPATRQETRMATVAVTKPHPIFLAGRWVESPDPLVVDEPGRSGRAGRRHVQRDRGAVRGGGRGRRRRVRGDPHAAGLRARPDPARDQRRDPRPPRGARPAHRRRGRQADPRRAGRGRPRGADLPARRRGGGADDRRDRSRSTCCRRRKDRVGITRRFPIGPIAGISPFNFPLNLAAHKVAPAIASGNPIVLKPPSKDPLTMLTVAEIIEAAGVPAGLGQRSCR